ncbi:F-box domain-containing protein [Teratosphaeria destructans]|uniref:F-box domain-containing protein n=1 Tax=Teratosphaeria destructans TaxID=418781 RepID=A0A9W7SKN0_9PEZI|nr:F-box domain-containing protein [Teratosphaeria destructans]
MDSDAGNMDDASVSASTDFNPQAPDFVPGAASSRPSTKRKASSSAKPGPSGAGPSRITRAALTDAMAMAWTLDEKEMLTDFDSYPARPCTPIVRAKDILPMEEPAAINDRLDEYPCVKLRPGFAMDSDDEDIESLLPRRLRRRYRNGELPPGVFSYRHLGGVRDSASSPVYFGSAEKAPHHPAQRLSAVLISRSVKPDGSYDVRYLPLCDASNAPGRTQTLTVLASHRSRTAARSDDGASRCTWPADVLPVELFDSITQYLCRDDIEAMRLVNREFERKVAISLFNTCVVPFNTELYDMIEEGTKSKARQFMHGIQHQEQGKDPATNDDPKELDPLAGQLQWQNAKEDKEGKVYKGHGLRVFEGFGPHIRKFGMTFEVSENQLLQPSVKREYDPVGAYHGIYDWPTAEYARFDDRAGLERTADEISRMKAAFSKLTIVKELGLSVDSGLGWLSGPDKSVRSQIFSAPPPIFGKLHQASDRRSQAAVEFWNALQDSQDSFIPSASNKEITLGSVPMKALPDEIPGFEDTRYGDTSTWSQIDPSSLPAAAETDHSDHRVLYTTPEVDPNANTATASMITPNELRKEQKEWLLETEWAQQAFLESYTLAVIDNAGFERITSLRIAKLSSRFINKLSTEAFWAAMPALQNVLVHVSPDWRTVAKNDAGYAEMTPVNPSEAVCSFYDLLSLHITPLELKTLNIGWVRDSGGEHAQGIYARNKHLLPAPISQLARALASTAGFSLVFKTLEQLTLTNCWITPPMLQGLVESHAGQRLRKLTLDSVSLTAHPRFPIIAHQQQQLAQQPPPPPHAAAPQFMQVLQTLVNQPPLPPLPGMPAFMLQPSLHWSEGHREGSWPALLNELSPGSVLTDFLPAPQEWETPRPSRPQTSLHTIECISCGYARLENSNAFDQNTIGHDLLFGPRSRTWFRMRRVALKPLMMETKDPYVGQIVQQMEQRELDALQFAWGMTCGWSDFAKAEEAQYDGYLRGGSGRFSGVIQGS